MHITRAQRVRLGLFLVASAALIVLATLLVLGRKQWQEPTLYRTRFHESVSGLEASGPVRAEGKLVSLGRRVAFSEARLVDAQGRLCASATSTLLVFPIAPPP